MSESHKNEITVVCPYCKGRCCRNIDTGYRVEHMGAQVYSHDCDYCQDGTASAFVHTPGSRDAALLDTEKALSEVSAKGEVMRNLLKEATFYLGRHHITDSGCGFCDATSNFDLGRSCPESPDYDLLERIKLALES